ncbi:MAG: hypothetical protein OEU98_08295, partial [Actinomycetota bacterium]|nr:hypothetical protein [Actinomycetota bacterium]
AGVTTEEAAMGARRAWTARVSTAAMLAALGLGVAGCGGSDGETTIVTEDGSITIDENGDEGSITIESSEGSMTITGESGGDLPESWPSVVAVPEGGTITASAALTGEEPGWTVSLVYTDISATDLAADVKAELEAAGFEQQSEVNTGEGALGTYTGNGYGVTAMAGEDDSEVTLVMTVAETG